MVVKRNPNGTFGNSTWVNLNYPGVVGWTSDDSVAGNQVVGIVIGKSDGGSAGVLSFQATVNADVQLAGVKNGHRHPHGRHGAGFHRPWAERQKRFHSVEWFTRGLHAAVAFLVLTTAIPAIQSHPRGMDENRSASRSAIVGCVRTASRSAEYGRRILPGRTWSPPQSGMGLRPCPQSRSRPGPSG